MYLTRQKASTRLPIPRKGTTYVARALSHLSSGVPVVIAVRDMLKLATTAHEVKKMIHQQLLKINGKIVKDSRESIRLFNLFDADKTYLLTLLPTGRFSLEETKQQGTRLAKIVNRRLVAKGKMQLNVHDGTNLITKEDIRVGDSVVLDLEGNIKKHIPLEKGREAFVLSGKYEGQRGKIAALEGRKVIINFKEITATLDSSQIIVQ